MLKLNVPFKSHAYYKCGPQHIYLVRLCHFKLFFPFNSPPIIRPGKLNHRPRVKIFWSFLQRPWNPRFPPVFCRHKTPSFTAWWGFKSTLGADEWTSIFTHPCINPSRVCSSMPFCIFRVMQPSSLHNFRIFSSL